MSTANILIIGATSGIGYELWRYYASNGYVTYIMGRRGELLDKMENEYRDTTFTYKCDISDVESFDKALNAIVSHSGKLSTAIVCAGIGDLNPELNKDIELETVTTNVAGWTNAVASIYTFFERQGGGHLVTITSVGGMQPTPVAPAYSASKAFQINYTRSLQRKSKGTGVTVTEIRPGLVATRMAKGEGLFWVMPVNRVCPQIIDAIKKSKRLSVVTRRWRIINYILKHL